VRSVDRRADLFLRGQYYFGDRLLGSGRDRFVRRAAGGDPVTAHENRVRVRNDHSGNLRIAHLAEALTAGEHGGCFKPTDHHWSRPLATGLARRRYV